jgi:hypothetical protein
LSSFADLVGACEETVSTNQSTVESWPCKARPVVRPSKGVLFVDEICALLILVLWEPVRVWVKLQLVMLFLVSPIFSFRELPTPCIGNFWSMNTTSKSCTLDRHFGGIQTMRMGCTHSRAMLPVYATNCWNCQFPEDTKLKIWTPNLEAKLDMSSIRDSWGPELDWLRMILAGFSHDWPW